MIAAVTVVMMMVVAAVVTVAAEGVAAVVVANAKIVVAVALAVAAVEGVLKAGTDSAYLQRFPYAKVAKNSKTYISINQYIFKYIHEQQAIDVLLPSVS